MRHTCHMFLETHSASLIPAFDSVQFPVAVRQDPNYAENVEIAMYHASLEADAMLRASPVDDSLSGTTLVAAALVGTRLHVANVGDSRAVLAVRADSQLVAKELSWDQTPMRSDEAERVKAYGTRVLSGKQIGGTEDPSIQHWTTQVHFRASFARTRPFCDEQSPACQTVVSMQDTNAGNLSLIHI